MRTNKRRQSFDNAKADYEAAAEISKTQQQLLDYYTIRAPYDGVVGDVPVHIGDYVAPSSTTPLTTVDEGKDLEAYVYIPTERTGQIKMGLPIDLLDNSGNLIEKTKIDFVSAQVDMSMQGILVKAPVHSAPDRLRNAQLVKARVIWTTRPMAVVPVLAVIRLSGQTFVYVARQQNGRYFRHADRSHAGRHGRQYVFRCRRTEPWRQGDHLRHSVPGESNAGYAHGRLMLLAGPFAMQAE